MKEIHTYYDNLKVSRTAPPEVIRAAYKSLAQKYHPDKNPNNQDAVRIMKLINEAYEILSDPNKRKDHDKWIAEQEEIKKQENIRSQMSQQWQRAQQEQRQQQEKRAQQEQRKQQEQRAQQERRQQQARQQQADFESKNNKNDFKILGGIIFAIGIFLAIAIPLYNKSNSYDDNVDTTSTTLNDSIPLDSNNTNNIVDEKKVYKTSFDCTKRKSIVEDLICTNADLAMADLELAGLLHQAKEAVVDKNKLAKRIRKQWNYREKNCKDTKCVADWFVYEKDILTQIIQSRDVNAGISTAELMPKPLPLTGSADNPNLNGVAPLQIKTPYDGDHYYVKIDDALSKEHLVSYFIRSGESLNVDLPIGSYTIKYAYGQKWYGNDLLFGEKTGYAQASKVFTFQFDGYQYNGYTIELIKQVNGNLQTNSIEPSQF